ncbi:unnamed protein product [Mycena citricolor]|uniref:Uncharacterized protein n=1 Tax=Mycena citricolor TaxID=2018698 RepID=A0AAD2HE85_9AGAR|nr:unnamed protein product [Mycena citricolor]
MRARIIILLLQAALLHFVSAETQAPFRIGALEQNRWRLDHVPHLNDTSNFIFETVNSLLQHWPNTRYRNGHTIVPGTIPVGTLLYHGRRFPDVPKYPDWTSLDPEHSYHFCGSDFPQPRNWEGQEYREAQTGAANMITGTLDSQDLLIWGDADPKRWLDEGQRISGLCKWGKEFGIDGFVRMEMDFEVMVCDFENGLKLDSADFLASWYPRWEPPISSAHRSDVIESRIHDDADPLIVRQILGAEVLRAGMWHNRYPGDIRIQLDLSRAVSFYDIDLVPSLVAHRLASQDRFEHRLINISAADLHAVNLRLRSVLAEPPAPSASGVDWKALFHVPVARYSDRLELVSHLLQSRAEEALIHVQLRVMLTPYILHSAVPDGAHDGDAWAVPIWKKCATRHSDPIRQREDSLTPSERTLLAALEGVNREICRVVVGMWALGVHAGLDPLIPGDPGADSVNLVDSWRASLQNLMSWLDWSVWIKCRPACGAEELCYLSTWPYFWSGLEEGSKPPPPDAPYLRPNRSASGSCSPTLHFLEPSSSPA